MAHWQPSHTISKSQPLRDFTGKGARMLVEEVRRMGKAHLVI